MRTAVVVGAGIGGLAAAAGLARCGWQVTILEGADRVPAGPTALILWPNGMRALAALGLGGGLSAVATPVPDAGVRRPDGQWLVPPRPTGATAGPVVVHREDLHDALVAGLGDRVEIRTGIRVSSVSATGEHRPAVGDGRSTFDADLIVAADGIDSVVRRRLAPEALVVASGCVAWRAVIPWYRASRLPEDRPVGAEVFGAGYRFVATPLGVRGSAGGSGRGGIYWIATAAGAPRPEPPATQLALLRRWFAGWPAPVGQLLAATDPADLVHQEVRELHPLPRSYAFPAGAGGAVLVGDAAHAMPHHLGQGAGLALEDAVTLAWLVREAAPGTALRSALRSYDRVRRRRAETVVRQTRRMSAALGGRRRLALRARTAARGAVTPRLLSSAAAAAAQWHPPA